MNKYCDSINMSELHKKYGSGSIYIYDRSKTVI